jgi:heptosyltransferase-2
MNILVRVPNWLGDSILSIPALKFLSNDRNNDLTIIAHKRVKEIFEGLSFVNRVFTFERGITYWMKLRKEHFDYGVLFPNSFSSALFLSISGIKKRAGYNTEGRGFLLTHSLPLPRDYRERHLTETYLDLVNNLNSGREITSNNKYQASGIDAQFSEPIISITPEDEEKAKYLLQGTKNPIGICPEAAYGPAKRWGKFPELALKLQDYGNVVFLGAANSQLPVTSYQFPVLDLRGKTSLKETAAVLRRCRIFITNDSGLGHLASTVGTPVLSIFGSTSPVWTRPLGKSNRILYNKQLCSPCFARTCRFGTYACLEEISVEEVYKNAFEMLEVSASQSP